MRVRHLIQQLNEIAENGGEEATTGIRSVQYWEDDMVTFSFYPEPEAEWMYVPFPASQLTGIREEA